MTAGALNTLHNLFFYLDTMRRVREAIAFGTFEKFRQDFHRTFSRRP
jgi:queuine tRNA-ribosyltransferase